MRIAKSHEKANIVATIELIVSIMRRYDMDQASVYDTMFKTLLL
jgi:hypothetical protein